MFQGGFKVYPLEQFYGPIHHLSRAFTSKASGFGALFPLKHTGLERWLTS